MLKTKIVVALALASGLAACSRDSDNKNAAAQTAQTEQNAPACSEGMWEQIQKSRASQDAAECVKLRLRVPADDVACTTPDQQVVNFEQELAQCEAKAEAEVEAEIEAQVPVAPDPAESEAAPAPVTTEVEPAPAPVEPTAPSTPVPEVQGPPAPEATQPAPPAQTVAPVPDQAAEQTPAPAPAPPTEQPEEAKAQLTSTHSINEGSLPVQTIAYQTYVYIPGSDLFGYVTSANQFWSDEHVVVGLGKRADKSVDHSGYEVSEVVPEVTEASIEYCERKVPVAEDTFVMGQKGEMYRTLAAFPNGKVLVEPQISVEGIRMVWPFWGLVDAHDPKLIDVGYVKGLEVNCHGDLCARDKVQRKVRSKFDTDDQIVQRVFCDGSMVVRTYGTASTYKDTLETADRFVKWTR